ncbi:MAG TPA: GNAT family N-acetyltransferase [Streptomyces sp.]|nr:GNAT family N-acetyltransferase [Streptomyces sp.]
MLVRVGAEEDLEALTDMYNHYILESPATFDTEPFTPEERRDWLLSHIEDGPYRLLVAQQRQIAGNDADETGDSVRSAGTAAAVGDRGTGATSGRPCRSGRSGRSGQILGYATSSQFRPRRAYDTSVEVSCYLAPGAAGRGLGTLLYKHLFEALEGQDLHRAYAGITVPNDASVRLHQRFGFELVGTYREAGRKFGRYYDVQRYEKALGPTT